MGTILLKLSSLKKWTATVSLTNDRLGGWIPETCGDPSGSEIIHHIFNNLHLSLPHYSFKQAQSNKHI